ncbi:hypothetical protein APY04_3296 [Hyphomicrobium sulfonivorans]|uniref:Uncharacterized protein n=1 Tax=Hyphomicrobium sulfonivorans TaxID=121290 RepID=A0A109B8Z8_HYPSL|nr:hypothetical protein APY04_3296 [Hyphomicrobium sulfonivorans]
MAVELQAARKAPSTEAREALLARFKRRGQYQTSSTANAAVVLGIEAEQG